MEKKIYTELPKKGFEKCLIWGAVYQNIDLFVIYWLFRNFLNR